MSARFISIDFSKRSLKLKEGDTTYECGNLLRYPNADLLHYLYVLRTGTYVSWASLGGGLNIEPKLWVDVYKLATEVRRTMETVPNYSCDLQAFIELHTEHIARHNNSIKLSYNSLLKTLKWQKKRFAILDRDKHECRSCGYKAVFNIQRYDTRLSYQIYNIERNSDILDISKFLHSYHLCEEVYKYDWLENLHQISSNEGRSLQVHHSFYLLTESGKLFNPWDYPSESLVTVCGRCHTTLHKKLQERNMKIPTLIQRAFGIYDVEKFEVCECVRCNGAGWLEQFRHVQNGICFLCYGVGTMVRTLGGKLITVQAMENEIEKQIVFIGARRVSTIEQLMHQDLAIKTQKEIIQPSAESFLPVTPRSNNEVYSPLDHTRQQKITQDCLRTGQDTDKNYENLLRLVLIIAAVTIFVYILYKCTENL